MCATKACFFKIPYVVFCSILDTQQFKSFIQNSKGIDAFDEHTYVNIWLKIYIQHQTTEIMLNLHPEPVLPTSTGELKKVIAETFLPLHH